jgi:outer membrane protein assembly factor BamB
MTTTYTMDVGSDTQVNTPATFAWIENYTVPAYDMGGSTSLGNGGNIIITDKALECIWCFDEATGALKWTTYPFNNDFVMQSTTSGVVANGMLYNPGYDGYMHAINITTGVQMWDTSSIMGGLEMPQPYYPMSGCTVADGKVYSTTAKAYEVMPLYRGHCLICFDATTGAQLWNISGQIPISAIAQGYLIGVNAYDGNVYAFHAGPTATTVSAPSNAIQAGTPGVITGTVTDQTQTSQAMGTPAISDAWMTPWMEYLYMNQPLPTSATGVPVSIDAVDPNGNFIHIGNATSDITGNYHYTWTPPNIPGTYTIVATFSADNSYYGSSGETAAVVVSAATTVTPTPTPTSVADMYFVPAIAGLAVLIIVGLIVLALLMLRKRP